MTTQKHALPTVTVDELAVITANGFTEVDKNFIKVDKKFAEVDRQFVEVKQDIDDLALMTAKEFKIVHKDISDLKTEMHEGFSTVRSEMKQGFSEIKETLATMNENMATKSDVAKIAREHDTRLRRVERKLQTV